MANSFLLINATDFLLINAGGDKLIISGDAPTDVGGGNGGRLKRQRWRPPEADDEEVISIMRQISKFY
jgi:hypothetical protein